ncbi:hypothetical protein [Candidatus Profftia lariciata]|uniref:hypothetical protein n=1 Tax=Candidatus Profftia lariciata TaxID=1987921 RepID=UPI001D009BEC|nr:hypothetical protein [Candidatus Profftia lariciata]
MVSYTKHNIKCIESHIRNDASSLIEECIILAHVATVCFVTIHEEPFLYCIDNCSKDKHFYPYGRILNYIYLILKKDKS